MDTAQPRYYLQHTLGFQVHDVAHHTVAADTGTRTPPGRTETFDTLQLARRLLPGTDSYKLGALVEAFQLAEGLPDDLSPHRATYDALVTARLFLHLATSLNARALTLEQLRDRTRRGSDGGTAALF